MSINNLGEKLSQLRKINNYTQKDLAKKLNVSSQLISKWETNSATPSLEYIVDICHLYNVSLDELLETKPTTPTAETTTTNKQVANKKTKTKIKLSKKMLIALCSVAGAIAFTALVLLTIFVFVPFGKKEDYINDISQSINTYLDGGYFNVSFYEKLDGSSKSDSYKGYVNENGVSLDAYSGVLIGNQYYDHIVDNINYSKSYKEVFTSDITTTHQLFEYVLSTVGRNNDYMVDEDDIKYIRKVKDGFTITLNKDLITNSLNKDDLEFIKFKSKLKCSVTITDGKFKKLEMSVVIRNTLKEENFSIVAGIEAKHEKPVIKPNTSLFWATDNIIENQQFVEDIHKDKTVTLTDTSNASSLSSDIGNNYPYFEALDKVWFIKTDYSGDIASLHGYKISPTQEITFTEYDIINYTIIDNFWYLYDNYFIFYSPYYVRMLDLNTGNVSSYQATKDIYNETTIGHVQTYNQFMTFYAYKDSSFSRTIIYDIENNKFYWYNEKYIQQDKYLYRKTSSSISYMDINNRTLKSCNFDIDINSIGVAYISDAEDVYYYYNNKIYKYGSTYEYNYGDKVTQKDGNLLIFNKELQLCYTYLGETLISTTPYIVEENNLEDFFLDKDILFIDDQNNIYINNSSKIYQGSENNYLELDTLYVLDKNGNLETTCRPQIIYATQDYFIGLTRYYYGDNGYIRYVLYYTLNDLSKPQFTTVVENYYAYYNYNLIKFANFTLVAIDKNVYIVS